MKRWAYLIPFLFGSILTMGCSEGVQDDNSLGDLAGSAYQGDLAEADLGPFVRVTDDDATLRITFTRPRQDLVARMRLSEGIDYYHEGEWQTFDGPDTKDVESLTIEDCIVSGKVKLGDVTLSFQGEFNEQRTSMDATVNFVGTVTLTAWNPPQVEEDEVADNSEDDTGEGGDTGQDDG